MYMYNPASKREEDKGKCSSNLIYSFYKAEYSTDYTPYSICPMGLSSSTPGAIKLVLGSPVAFAAEQRAIVGELYDESI